MADGRECPNCLLLLAKIVELEALIRSQEGRIKDLEARLKPPQEPRPAAEIPAGPDKKPTGRKPGGQAGHPPHLRRRMPPESVDETVHHFPPQCSKCSSALPADAGPGDPEPKWHQTVELPVRPVIVTEHLAHTRICPCCGERNEAVIPEGTAPTPSARGSPPPS